jgi:hypothetical protein
VINSFLPLVGQGGPHAKQRVILGDAWNLNMCHPLTSAHVIVLSERAYGPTSRTRRVNLSGRPSVAPYGLFLAQMVCARLPISLHVLVASWPLSFYTILIPMLASYMRYTDEYLATPQTGASSTLSMVVKRVQGPVSLLVG